MATKANDRASTDIQQAGPRCGATAYLWSYLFSSNRYDTDLPFDNLGWEMVSKLRGITPMAWLYREMLELKHTHLGKPRTSPSLPASLPLLNFQGGFPVTFSLSLQSPFSTLVYFSPIYGETRCQKVCPDPLFSPWNLITWLDNLN